MRVCVVLEHRFYQTVDEAVWSGGPFPCSFWRRYLDVFDEVRVIARVQPVSSARPTWKRADAEGVDFARVPYYLGPQQYLRKWRAVRRAVRGAVGEGDAVILRVSSQLGSVLFPVLRQARRPYAVEVVADPYDVFSPGANRHPLRPLFRRWFSRTLRRHCREAFAAAYVTAEALQRRYPPGPNTHAIACSDVELPPPAIADRHRQFSRENGRPRTLVMVGTLAQLYKAPDVLVDAVARCVQGKLDLRLVFVGDGKHRRELQARAAGQGLNGRVSFLGQLSAGEAVRAVLDQADLFVLPSRQEGLPRAMVEAMARGLPCIGSTIGGIPELLPPEDLVPPGDVEALSCRIREVVGDPQRMERMSLRNLQKAKEYREELLAARRRDFYRYVRSKTEEWLQTHRAALPVGVPPSGAAGAQASTSPSRLKPELQHPRGQERSPVSPRRSGKHENLPGKAMLVCNRDIGVWRFRRGLIEALLERRIAVVVVTPQGPYVEKIVELGARHVPVALSEFVDPRRDLRMCFDLYRIFRAEKPDIVHNMTIKPNVYGSLAARLAGVPKIVSLVNGAGTGFAEGGGWKRAVLRFIVRRLYKISGRTSTCMYFQNPDDLELFVRLGIVKPEKALLVRSGGINIEEFSIESVSRDTLDDLRTELEVEPQTQVVLMVVGRAIWSKGVRQFVEVSRCARQWDLPAKFVLVGPIEPHNPDAVPEEYLRSASSPGFVHLGFRDDIRELLALASVVVLPSYYREGVPRVLLEALAMGKPVVTTDSVGCREVVEHGKNGFLVPAKDSRALGSAIRTLLEDGDLQTAFGAHSLVKAREEFDERKIVERILTDVYGLPAAGRDAGCSTDKHLVTT